eukprot:TRINITY_DN11894_c0_g1_i1.p1 TRINITY_DN11894_c0_g1~~TRINITY_DN11894_c0_g1_i1.p1  ORF type:complete len:223 (-),score=41.91 TRINITY_DN11894_c0_g1_i1:56-682(-)
MAMVPPLKTMNDLKKCSNSECLSTNMVEDLEKGDVVCADCGRVCSEKVIDDGAEWRQFDSEPGTAERSRVGSAYHVDIGPQLTSRTSKYDKDDLQFLHMGLRDIDSILFSLFDGCSRNVAVENRAKSIFNKAFQQQVDQKSGKVAFKKDKQRERFARRKQFVVAAVWKSLRKARITRWSISDISAQIGGRDVTEKSARKCLQDIHCNE